jgi:nitrogen regulatory protein PII
MKLVILITARVEKGLEIAQAWQDKGAPGVTILRTHGFHTLQRELRDGTYEVPRMIASVAGAMAHIIDNVEERGNLILSVVDDHLVDALVEEAQKELGDLTEPDSGVVFVLNIEQAIGVVQHGPDRK